MKLTVSLRTGDGAFRTGLGAEARSLRRRAAHAPLFSLGAGLYELYNKEKHRHERRVARVLAETHAVHFLQGLCELDALVPAQHGVPVGKGQEV